MNFPDDMVFHLSRIFVGEYEIGLNKAKPSVLDLGANVGAFAYWALVRWPDSTVTCYEPLPSNFKLLSENLQVAGARCILNNCAVGKQDEAFRKLYLGKHNCGEGSFFQGHEQQSESVDVQVVAASSIEYHDVVKIDVEGAEIEIIENLTFDPCVYLIEYHTVANKRKIEELLADKYVLVEHRIYQIGTGIVKFVRADVLKQ